MGIRPVRVRRGGQPDRHDRCPGRCRSTGYTYDLDNELIETIDPLGRVTTYSYDLMGRQTGETDAVGTPVQRTTTTVYDADRQRHRDHRPPRPRHDLHLRCPRRRGDRDHRRPSGRHHHHRLRRRSATSPRPSIPWAASPPTPTTPWIADERDRDRRHPVQRITTTVYDADGNVIETIDPLGRDHDYPYDALTARSTEIHRPLCLTTTTSTMPTATSSRRSILGPRPRTSTTPRPSRRDDRPAGPDHHDRLRRGRQGHRDDRPAWVDHHDLRRSTARSPRPSTRWAASTTTVYDADGNVIETIDPLGTHDHLHSTTPDGEVPRRSSRWAGTTTTVYDADDNVIATDRPAGPSRPRPSTSSTARSPIDRPAGPHDDDVLRRGWRGDRDDRPDGSHDHDYLRRGRRGHRVDRPAGHGHHDGLRRGRQGDRVIDPLGTSPRRSTTRTAR